MKLTQSQIDLFYDQGFLQLDDALGSLDLKPVIWEYEGLIDRRARKLYAEKKISSLHERAPFDQRIAVIGQESREIGDRLNAMYTRGPAIFNLMKNPTLLDIAESLIGPEILCHPTQQFRPRIPDRAMGNYVYSGSYSGWHQDAGVLAPEADNHLLVTIWIPLTEATVENGCLVVIPGSHKHGIRRHQPSPTPPVLFIPEEELPAGEPTPLPIEPGGVLLMHNYICHASLPNSSDRVRWSTDLRYQDSSKPIGHSYYPGFIVRSNSNPDSALKYPEWVSMWERATADTSARPPSWRWK